MCAGSADGGKDGENLDYTFHMQQQCELCSKIFEPLKPQRFCSRLCASRWAASQPRPRHKEKPQEETKPTTISCDICGKTFPRKGIGSHVWRSHGEGKNFQPTKVGEKVAWNKGLTNETSSKVAQISRSISITMMRQSADGTLRKKIMSAESRKKLSERQSSNNSGGRCKWYEVSGVKVQGTWERDLALKMNELGVDWNRPTSGLFPYTRENKQHNYTPDFFLPGCNIFLEVKGFWWGDDKNKMKLVVEQNPLAKKILLIEKGLFLRLVRAEHASVFLDLLQEKT